MKHNLLIALFFLNLMAFQSWAQVQISGTVTAANTGEPLPGVTILVVGTTNGTTTDIDGSYTLAAQPGDVLRFSYIGYLSEELTVEQNTATLNISLIEDIMSMDEIVVVGYGTQNKSDITGAITSIRPEDYNPGPVVSVSNYLQNTAPGVVMTQTSAQPGGNFNVQVRGQTSVLGSNAPLYVVDGMPITGDVSEPGTGTRFRSSPAKNPLNGINPEDIVSIEVLKDASAAAIYGARGANGVILITTKRGEKGKSRISYDGSYSIQEIANEYDLLSGTEYAKVANEWSTFLGNELVYAAAEVNAFGTGTNWMDQITRVGKIDRHQIAASGGNDRTTYYVSGNYFKHDGVVKSSSLTRYSARINLETAASDRLKVGVNASLSRTEDSQIHFGSQGGPEFSGLITNARNWVPILPVRQADGSFTPHPVFATQIPNPVSLLDIDDNIKTNRVLGNMYAEYTLLEGLKARLNVGVDNSDAKRTGYIPTTVLRGAQVNGEGVIGANQHLNLLSELTLNYNKAITPDHNIDALLGYTYQTFNTEGFSTAATNFTSQITGINDLDGAQQVLPSSSYKEQSKLISYIARANYAFKDKYLVTLTVRADGSTKFGANNKWGYFPSGAIGWKVDREDFFDSNLIDELKVRLSYGKTGNQEIGNKLSQSLYGVTRQFVLGERPVIGLSPTRPENRDLKWETTSQLDLGFDLSFLNGRIQTSLDLYRKITTDVLLWVALPSTTGQEGIFTNAGSIQNHGIELALKSTNISGANGALSWTTSYNIAYNDNKWKDRGNVPFSAVQEEFGPVSGLYAYIIDGVWQTGDDIAGSADPTAQPGYYKFRDVNDDGMITQEGDVVLVGSTQPDLTMGLNNTFTYKNFDLNFFFQGVFGVDRYNGTLAGLEDVNNILLGNNKSKAVLNRWTPDNPSNTIASGANNFNRVADGDGVYITSFIEDASFIKLRNITLGYNVPLPAKTFQSLRIYVDAQNALTFTKWKGIDPETGDDYPNARTYTIGLNVTF